MNRASSYENGEGNTAYVLFPPPYLRRGAFRASTQQLIAAYNDNRYSVICTIKVGNRVGEAAAEECFDITNNHVRARERVETCGNIRPVSVGDIVRIGGDAWLYCSNGWDKVS